MWIWSSRRASAGARREEASAPRRRRGWVMHMKLGRGRLRWARKVGIESFESAGLWPGREPVLIDTVRSAVGRARPFSPDEQRPVPTLRAFTTEGTVTFFSEAKIAARSAIDEGMGGRMADQLEGHEAGKLVEVGRVGSREREGGVSRECCGSRPGCVRPDRVAAAGRILQKRLSREQGRRR